MSGGGFGSVPAFPPVDDFFVGVLGEDPAAVPDIFEGRKRGEPRKLKIVCIGAGATGIYTAIRHQGLARGHEAVKNMDLTIYEKNSLPGGTWLENRYAGVECDVPSHLYTFTFEVNPYWSHAYSGAEEIWEYFNSIYQKYNVEKFVVFETKITRAEWDEGKGVWKLEWTRVKGDAETPEKGTDEAHILINGSGALNTIRYPDIEGLDSFAGKTMHSARWDSSYPLDGKRVCVIGTGASAIQIVPGIQPRVGGMVVFQRTAVWVTVKGIGPNKFNGLYTDAEKEKFASDPAYHEKYRLDLWDSYETRFFQFQRNSEMQKEVVKIYRERYEREVRPELREKIMPNYGVGCRRITPSDTYLKALQAENTELVTEPIKRITPKGIETTDGRLHECDLLILATGFDTSFKPVFPLIGRGGKTLQEEWKIIPESYLSVGAPGFPNYWMVIGPNSPLGQNSLLPWLEGTVDYIYEIALTMQRENIKAVDPKADVTKKWNDYTQTFLKDYVWSDSCSAWYKAKDGSGRVSAIWPGNANSFLETLENVRWQDFDVTFMDD